MAEYYPTTAVPFDGMPLPALRDPVLAGMSTVGDVGFVADEYRSLSDILEKASEDLRAAMDASQGAHDGEAAAAARHYVMRIAAMGELGAAQACISMDSLQQGISYYARARDDMAAIPRFTDDGSLDAVRGPRIMRLEEEHRVLAVEAAQRYESNTNWTMQRQFQPYEPEQIAPPGAIGGGTGGGGGGIGGAGGAGVTGPAGGASAAGAGARDGGRRRRRRPFVRRRRVPTPDGTAVFRVAPCRRGGIPDSTSRGRVQGRPGRAGCPGRRGRADREPTVRAAGPPAVGPVVAPQAATRVAGRRNRTRARATAAPRLPRARARRPVRPDADRAVRVATAARR